MLRRPPRSTLIDTLLPYTTLFRSLNQPTYLLFAAFIVVGMVTMVANGWVGGALVRFLEFLPSLFALLLVAQASHSPKNCFRIMWIISLCAVVLTIHGIGQVRLGPGWTGMPTVPDGRIQYVGLFRDRSEERRVGKECVSTS